MWVDWCKQGLSLASRKSRALCILAQSGHVSSQIPAWAAIRTADGIFNKAGLIRIDQGAQQGSGARLAARHQHRNTGGVCNTQEGSSPPP